MTASLCNKFTLSWSSSRDGADGEMVSGGGSCVAALTSANSLAFFWRDFVAFLL